MTHLSENVSLDAASQFKVNLFVLHCTNNSPKKILSTCGTEVKTLVRFIYTLTSKFLAVSSVMMLDSFQGMRGKDYVKTYERNEFIFLSFSFLQDMTCLIALLYDLINAVSFRSPVLSGFLISIANFRKNIQYPKAVYLWENVCIKRELTRWSDFV